MCQGLGGGWAHIDITESQLAGRMRDFAGLSTKTRGTLIGGLVLKTEVASQRACSTVMELLYQDDEEK